MNTTGDIHYIMGGFPFFNHAMALQMHALNIYETILHGVWESFCNVRQALPELLLYMTEQVLELMLMHPKERLGRVISTASWFNSMNIGYRFHTSTVCHSCCNNVMYISEENLDISGSAWKKCHADMAFLLARIVLVLKLYRTRAVFAPCKHQQPDCGPDLAYHLWHTLIFALYRYDSNKCI